MQFQYGDYTQHDMDKIQKKLEAKYDGPQNSGATIEGVKVSIPLGELIIDNKIDPNLKRRSALKSILDRWSLMAISVEDAERELMDLLAVRHCDGFEAQLGTLKCHSPSGMGWDFKGEIDGHPLLDFRKMTITIEMGKRIGLLLEAAVGYVPQTKKVES